MHANAYSNSQHCKDALYAFFAPEQQLEAMLLYSLNEKLYICMGFPTCTRFLAIHHAINPHLRKGPQYPCLYLRSASSRGGRRRPRRQVRKRTHTVLLASCNSATSLDRPVVWSGRHSKSIVSTCATVFTTSFPYIFLTLQHPVLKHFSFAPCRP